MLNGKFLILNEKKSSMKQDNIILDKLFAFATRVVKSLIADTEEMKHA